MYSAWLIISGVLFSVIDLIPVIEHRSQYVSVVLILLR